MSRRGLLSFAAADNLLRLCCCGMRPRDCQYYCVTTTATTIIVPEEFWKSKRRITTWMPHEICRKVGYSCVLSVSIFPWLYSRPTRLAVYVESSQPLHIYMNGRRTRPQWRKGDMTSSLNKHINRARRVRRTGNWKLTHRIITYKNEAASIEFRIFHSESIECLYMIIYWSPRVVILEYLELRCMNVWKGIYKMIHSVFSWRCVFCRINIDNCED